MKKKITAFIILVLFFSCKKFETITTFPKEKKTPKVYEFGFKTSEYNILFDTIKDGDSFEKILKNQNLGNISLYNLSQKIKDSFSTNNIKKGKTYFLFKSKDRYKRLKAFVYQPNKSSYYVIDLRDSIVVYKKIKPIKIRQRTITGKLNGSLFEELNKQKVSTSLANKISKIYAWSIDFFKLKKGHKFGITFTERFIDDTIYDGVDSVKAAFFEYKGKLIYAFPFIENNTTKKREYYDEKGKALKNFFLKAPLKFVNISSKFSKKRFHPVQHIWKSHKGTDYAAPTGTPIMTTAAGIVEQTGYTAGNGNFVKIKHNKIYSTQYLHMSKILVKKGKRVAQGEIIGKVGSTGLASGPHLCYRFWKNGVQVDALKLKLPNSQPMEKKNITRYLAYIKPLKRELDSIANK